MARGQLNKTELRAAMLTDVGVVRDHNEDSAHIDEHNRFFIVADGMGGHAAGEVASAMAVDTVRHALEDAADQLEEFAGEPDDDGRKNAVATLEQAVRAAHQAVYDRGVNEADKHGMGTTLDVVLVAGSEAFIAHVGDSRTYLIRNGKAAQITTDHTVAEVLVIEGKLSLEEAQISPLRTILVNAIGVAPDVGVEMAHVQLRKGDLLLLCSDGLHDYFPVEQELADHIVGSEPSKALDELIDLAKERGGHDNITGVVVEVVECESTGENVPDTIDAEISNGVPGKVERDDTLPVDIVADEKATIPLNVSSVAALADEDDEDEDDEDEDEGKDAAEGSVIDDDDDDDDGADGKNRSVDALRATQPVPVVKKPEGLSISDDDEDEDEVGADDATEEVPTEKG
jgi:serine/threonine protein phosphatase PrpC